MSAAEARRITLETLDRINKATVSGSNVLVGTISGEINEGAAYIELIQSIIKLYEADN